MDLRNSSPLLFTFALVMAFLLYPQIAKAEIPYGTFSYDNDNGQFFMQPAYVPVGFIGFNLVPDDKAGTANLKEPNDIFIDSNDRLYVADTKNDRILVLDQNHKLVRTVGTAASGPGKLKEPNGVFVDQKQNIFAADTGNKRIVVFDNNGVFLREYTRPKTEYLPDSYKFEPTKLVTDKRGFLYVATNGGYQGLLVLEPDQGEFQGFYGANKVKSSPIDSLKRRFFTEAQLKKEISRLPGTVSNLTIDKDGLIYTTSISVTTGQVKKLNFSGKDLLGGKFFGNRRLRVGQEQLFTDVTVDRIGNITAVDAASGLIYQYDPFGSLLFAFGGKSDGSGKLGMFNYAASLASDSRGYLYVVDRTSNLIHMFRPTEFADLVHQANELYMLGKYEESEKPWKEVLHLNSKYYKAHIGIAKSYYRKSDWGNALAEFRKAGDIPGYSDALWQLRLRWMQTNFSYVMTTVVLLLLVVLLLAYLRKKSVRNSAKRGQKHGSVGRSTETSAQNITASH